MLKSYGFCIICVYLVYVVVILMSNEVKSDKSWRTLAYSKCTEKRAPFRSTDCNYYTSYTAIVDLIGGGSTTQNIEVVGNQENRVIDLINYPDGGIKCGVQPGTTCTPLTESSKTSISVVRSPLPPGVPRVLEGSNTSLAFYWQLSRSEYTPNNGLPLFYGVFKDYNYEDYPELPEATASPDYGDYQFTKNACSSINPETVELVDLSDIENQGGQDIKEPLCSVRDLGSPVNSSTQFYGTEETSFYSGYTNISKQILDGCRSPEGNFRCENKEKSLIMDDVDGTCTAICCGDRSSIRVRPVGPQCYLYTIEPKASIAVDFAVVVNNELLGGDVVIPIYGILNPGSGSIVVEDKGIRVTVKSVKEGFPRLSNLDAFQVSSGEIVSCGDWNKKPEDDNSQCPDTQWKNAFPNQIDGPYGPSSNMTWRYLPASLRSMYAELTTRQSASLQPINGTSVEQNFLDYFTSLYSSRSKQFGESSSIIESNIVAAINHVYSLQNSSKGVDVCVGIYDALTASDPDLQKKVQSLIFQNVPGYVLKKDPSTGEFIYNEGDLITDQTLFPSLCEVTSALFPDNPKYFPPAWNNTSPNWWIRQGIPNVGNSRSVEDSQSYLLFAPSQELIEELGATQQLQNSVMIEVSISSEYMKYENEQHVPVSISSILQNPKIVDTTWYESNSISEIVGSKIINNCVLPSVEEIQYAVRDAKTIKESDPVTGMLVTQVLSLQSLKESNLVNVQGVNGLEKTIVELSCTPIQGSGNLGSTPTVDWSPKGPISIEVNRPGELVNLDYNITVDFPGSGYVNEVLVNTVKLINCTVKIYPELDGSEGAVLEKQIQCMVGSGGLQATTTIYMGKPYSGGLPGEGKRFDNTYVYPDKPSRESAISDIEECGFCDYSCRDIGSSACFWLNISIGFILLSELAISIGLIVRLKLRNNLEEKITKNK